MNSTYCWWCGMVYSAGEQRKNSQGTECSEREQTNCTTYCDACNGARRQAIIALLLDDPNWTSSVVRLITHQGVLVDEVS